LAELYGELLISSKQLETKISGLERKDISDNLNQVQEYLLELEEIVILMELVPISNVFRIFPRMVHNLAKQQQKQINFEIYDHDVRVDRKLLSEIGDITNHLIRNAIDHGSETIKERKKRKKPEEVSIVLETKILNNLLTLKVKDDGKGIDPEKIKQKAIEKGLISQKDLNEIKEKEILDMIFLPEFSTAEKLTKISGRGMGLNIVKDKLDNLNGTITFNSAVNEGTEFIVTLPLTRLLIKAILVEVEDQIFSIALDDIEHLYEIPKTKILEEDGKYYIYLNEEKENKKTPIYWIKKQFSFIFNQDMGKIKLKNKRDNEKLKLVHIIKGKKDFCLIVDDFLKQTEIIIKQINDLRGKVPGISGTAIMDDGRVSLIIDPLTIVS
ncbi:MAG: chemotaxis protein CheA, partial [Promethearchaeota archaeon]